jgi:NitT/TauT family transport system ATP-binding protein
MHESASQRIRIDCEDLQVQFADGSLGVTELTTQFPSGEITAVIGPSGCGKSTLLKAIAGLVTKRSGQVSFTSQPVSSKAFPARRGDLAFVFQDAALVPWRTARENVQLPLEITNTHAVSEWQDAVTRQLRAVELGVDQDAKQPAQLSGGMRMRVSIARALVTDPAVLLLDEPFGALDEMLRTRLGELLASLWQQRPRTILFVTHNISEAILLSHRLVILSHGKLAGELTNPLPFPRAPSLRIEPQFAAFYAEVAARLAEGSR